MKTTLKESIREFWLELRDWINYVRNCKENMQQMIDDEHTILELNRTIERKDKKIEKLKITNEVKNGLLDEKDEKIFNLKTIISEMKKEDNVCEEMKQSKNMTHTDIKE